MPPWLRGLPLLLLLALTFFLLLAETNDDISTASNIGSEPNDPFFLSIFEKVTEGSVSMVGFIEGGFFSLHRLFD